MTIKQWIVIREDLNMRKGKMVTQGAHASMAVFINFMREDSKYSSKMYISSDVRTWLEGGATKVVVGVDSEAELLEVYNQARQAKVPCSIITDAGYTEFYGQFTKTAVAIGPCKEDMVKHIVGHLNLL